MVSRVAPCTGVLLPLTVHDILATKGKHPLAAVVFSLLHALFGVALGKKEQIQGKLVPFGQSLSGMFNMLGTLCPCLETSQ